jgi:predicted dinucleotide-binding enzyme
LHEFIKMEDKMKVGVLGSGIVAKVLAGGFLQYNYDTMVGTRDSKKLSEWNSNNPRGKIGSFTEAAAFGDIVVLAVKGTAARDVLLLAGRENLAGKTIVDTTNPIADVPPINGVLKFFTSLDESLMERLQREFADARFVKAFSSVGNSRMVNPQFEGVKPTMFICGNNEEAKKKVDNILVQFGWEVADMGKAEAARAIEPLCILWCIPGFLNNQWTHAFKLLK